MSALHIGLNEAQLTVLNSRHTEGPRLHIGTADGVLSLAIQDDSGGAHVDAVLQDSRCLRPIVATYLLCQPNLQSLCIRSLPGTDTAQLWIGAARFAIPLNTAGLLHAWLARHIRPQSALAQLPDHVVQALHIQQARKAA